MFKRKIVFYIYIFYREGVELKYDGGRLESDIVSWFIKKAST